MPGLSQLYSGSTFFVALTTAIKEQYGIVSERYTEPYATETSLSPNLASTLVTKLLAEFDYSTVRQIGHIDEPRMRLGGLFSSILKENTEIVAVEHSGYNSATMCVELLIRALTVGARYAAEYSKSKLALLTDKQRKLDELSTTGPSAYVTERLLDISPEQVSVDDIHRSLLYEDRRLLMIATYCNCTQIFNEVFIDAYAISVTRSNSSLSIQRNVWHLSCNC